MAGQLIEQRCRTGLPLLWSVLEVLREPGPEGIDQQEAGLDRLHGLVKPGEGLGQCRAHLQGLPILRSTLPMVGHPLGPAVVLAWGLPRGEIEDRPWVLRGQMFRPTAFAAAAGPCDQDQAGSRADLSRHRSCS